MRHVMTAATLLACLATVPVHAQGRPVSLAIGLGGGWAGTTCGGCVASNENGPSGFVHLTAPVAPGLRLGAEYNRWSKTQFGEPSRFNYYMAIAELGLLDIRGLTAKVGAGYGQTRYRQWDVSPQPITTERSGPAYEVGFAYEVPLGRGVHLAPYSEVILTRHGDARVNGQPSDIAHSTSVLQYGVMLRTP
jgi:hypothetical protein